MAIWEFMDYEKQMPGETPALIGQIQIGSLSSHHWIEYRCNSREPRATFQMFVGLTMLGYLER